MSGETWDRELADLADALGRRGTIDPEQAEVLKRLVAEVGTLTADRAGRDVITVRTAVPLTADERSQLEELLIRRFGARWRVTFEVDPQLLGGVWLRVGARIIDGSLRGRLDALRSQMTAA